jgi:hypothetical protein
LFGRAGDISSLNKYLRPLLASSVIYQNQIKSEILPNKNGNEMFSWKIFVIQSSTFEGVFDKNPDFWWYTLLLAMNNSI